MIYEQMNQSDLLKFKVLLYLIRTFYKDFGVAKYNYITMRIISENQM